MAKSETQALREQLATMTRYRDQWKAATTKIYEKQQRAVIGFLAADSLLMSTRHRNAALKEDYRKMKVLADAAAEAVNRWRQWAVQWCTRDELARVPELFSE